MTPREGSGDVELLGGRKGSPVLGLSVPVYLAHVNSVCVRNASFFYIIIMFYFIFFTGLGSTQKHFFFDNVFYIYFSGLVGLSWSSSSLVVVLLVHALV